MVGTIVPVLSTYCALSMYMYMYQIDTRYITVVS